MSPLRRARLPALAATAVALLSVLVSVSAITACRKPSPPPEEEPAAEVAPVPQAEARPDRPLAFGEPLEGVPLQPNEEHAYVFHLEAGDSCQIRVEQRGIDLTLALRGPEGAELAATDSPNGSWGPEEVAVVAPAGGPHRLLVRGAAGAAPGEYSIHGKARRRATEADHSRARALALLDEGERLRLRRQGKEAEALFRQALEELAALGDRRRSGIVRHRLALLARAEGDLPRALGLGRRALEDLASAAELDPEGATPSRADALAFVGLLDFDLERLPEAVEAWEEALALRRASGDLEGQARLLHNLGHAHQLLGNAQRALDDYEQSLELRAYGPVGSSGPAASPAPSRGRGETLHNLGALEISLGEEERGRRHLEAAAEVWEELGDFLAGARTLDQLGLADLAAGQADLAAERFEGALELRRKAGGGSAAVSLAHLGLARRQQGRLEEALDLGREALELFVAAGDRLGEARVRDNVGRLERDLGRPGQALAEHRRALELYRQVKDSAGESSALGALARDLRALGRTEEALAAVNEALGLFEARRDELHASGLRRSSLANAADRYALAVEILVELAGEDGSGPWALRALAASERARARGLLDALQGPPTGASGGPDESPGRPAEASLLEEAAALAEALSAAARRRTEILAAVPVSTSSLERAELRVEELAHRLEEVRGRLRHQRGVPLQEAEPLPAEELARWLAPGEILLEYHLGEDESYLWALTREGEAPQLTLHRLPGEAALAPLARRAHHLLARSHRREARGALVPVLCELQGRLLEPVAPRLGKRRILVSADGPLHYLPFGALPDPRHEGPCEAAPPLVRAQPVSALASLSARRAAARRPRGETRPALAVLADPDFGDGTSSLPPLPGTRREARRLAALSPEPAFLALGSEARKELFTAGTLVSYRWLHLATHAQVDDQRPELSALVLAAAGRIPERLLLHEIAGLELHAELVTLSACSTALGEEVRGEGLVGLRGAFLEAGAARVLVSLWDVSDDSTAELMERFYRALWSQGADPAEALRRAQISFLSEERHRAPHHWAAFVVSD